MADHGVGWFKPRTVRAGGEPSKGTPKDKRLKENKKAKITKARTGFHG